MFYLKKIYIVLKINVQVIKRFDWCDHHLEILFKFFKNFEISTVILTFFKQLLIFNIIADKYYFFHPFIKYSCKIRNEWVHVLNNN